MGLRKKLVSLAGSIAVFSAVLWGIPKLAPDVPDRYEGVSLPAPPSGPGSPTIPLPPGFPSMERPPKIEVSDGQPQPIATKYGLTYDIPAGWDNWSDGVAGWEFEDGSSVVFGSLGFYERTKCSDGEHSELAMTGMTGRRTEDLDATARTEVEKAERIFSNSDESKKPYVTISGPEALSIDERPAVRYRATVEDIPDAEKHCESRDTTFDVIATPAYASAQVAVFVVRADRNVDNALSDKDIDEIISTIRRS